MQNEAKLLNIAEAAQFLKISPDTLRRWEKKGIVIPQRSKGGFRKYTLIDLKIAKLNKRKARLFEIPNLIKENYINSKKDLKVAFITSFLWVLGIFTHQFLSPLLSMPTSPEQQILSDELKQQNHLKIGSNPTPFKSNSVSLAYNSIPGISLGSDLIFKGAENDSLEYYSSLEKYYTIHPLPKNDNNTLIKRN